MAMQLPSPPLQAPRGGSGGARGASLIDVSRFFVTAFRPQTAEDEEGVAAAALPSTVAPGHAAVKCEVPQSLLKELRDALAAEKGAELLPEGFLCKCLVHHHLCIKPAVTMISGFLQFRAGAGWPLRIPAHMVEMPQRTGVHWLIPLRRDHDRPADFVWSGNKGSTKVCKDAGPAGCIVLNIARMDSAACSVEEYQKFSMFVMERITDDPLVQQRGIALIVDFQGVQLSRMMSMVDMEDIRRGVSLWKGAFPCRLRRIWLLDAPAVLHYMLRGAVRLLTPTVRERVLMASRSSGLGGLREDLGPLFELPESLGGQGQFDWATVLRRSLAEDRRPHNELATALAPGDPNGDNLGECSLEGKPQVPKRSCFSGCLAREEKRWARHKL